MEIISLNHFLLAIILLCEAVILLNPIGCSAADEKDQKLCSADGKDHGLLFVFGDSLFDAGNNQYTNGTHFPTTSYPYGINNHNHSTGRFSDGLIVPDFIALYANLSILSPYLQPGVNFSDGASFAAAGAGVLDQGNGMIDFKTQKAYFKKVVSSMVNETGEAEAKKRLMKSVFLLSLGGNDYFMYNSTHPNATPDQATQHVKMVVTNLTNGIKELYDIRMRKIGIQNVGPLGCYAGTRGEHPEVKNGTCVEALQTLAAQRNAILSETMKKLSGDLYNLITG